MRNSSLSMRCHAGAAAAPPLIRSTTTVRMAASTAVPHPSPSPCRQCPSPTESCPPGTFTPKYAVVPARISGGVHVPAVGSGGDAREHLVGGRRPRRGVDPGGAAAAAGPAVEVKSLSATERDETARAPWRTDLQQGDPAQGR